MFSNELWGELPALRDELVVVEPFSRRDVPAMMSWNQDPEAQRWFDWPIEMPDHDQHEEDCLAVIDGWRTDWAAGRRAPFVVHHVTSGEVIGSVELQLNDDREWCISYLIHPDWRGRDIATRAVRLACRWAFSTLGANKIRLEAAEDNPASHAVARKAGFVDTGQRTKSQPLVNYSPEIGAIRTMIEYVLDRPRSPIPEQ